MRLPLSARVLTLVLALATAAVVLWPHLSRAVSPRRELLFTVWGMPFEDRLFQDRYAREYERLCAERAAGTDATPVTINYQRYADELLMKYNTWHARGRGADVMRIRITDYHGLVARGMLLRLDPYLDDPATGLPAADIANFPPRIMDALRTRGPRAGEGGGGAGSLYALPQDSAQFGLFYNMDLIDAHNARSPDQRVEYPDETWTWDTLREAAKRLTRHSPDGRITQAGIDFPVWSWPFMALLKQAGGELWSPDGSACTIDSPAGVRVLEFLRALQREDRSFRASLAAYNTGAGPDALFAAGRTAFYLDGSWRVPNLESINPRLRFAVAPLPRGGGAEGRAAVVCGGVAWAISSHAAHPDEAWEFIKWLVADEQQLAYWDMLRVAPPANLRVVASEAFTRTSGLRRSAADGALGEWEIPPLTPELFAARAEWLRHADVPHPITGEVPGFVPVHPFQTDLEEEIIRMLFEFLREDSALTPQQALDRAARNVNSLIARTRRGAAP